MNVEQLSRLARRAGHISDRADDRLTEVHARIRTARRRRTSGAVVGAAAVVAAVAVGVTSLTGSSDPRPSPAPKPDGVTPTKAESVRALTWTDEFWPSRRINYGDQVIDTRLDLTEYDFTQMDVTDEGVVVTTTDGRIWLAGAESVDHIATSGPRHEFIAMLVVSTGNAGSLAAWTDPRGDGKPTRVVYDTERRAVVASKPCPMARLGNTSCDPLWVGTDHVYYPASPFGRRVERLDVASGQLTVVSAAEYAADLLSQPRNLVLGESYEAGAVSDGIDVMFVNQGSRLVAVGVPEDLGGPLSPCGTDRCETSAFDTSGAPVRLRVPDGYVGARSFTVFQWLDDDRLALMAGAGGNFVFGIDNDLPGDNTGYGDILVCRIASGACELAVKGPELSGDIHRIVPDYGTPGTN